MHNQPTLRIGDAVTLLATGHLAARQYIGQIGKLLAFVYDSEGHVVAYDVKFPGAVARASQVVPATPRSGTARS